MRLHRAKARAGRVLELGAARVHEMALTQELATRSRHHIRMAGDKGNQATNDDSGLKR